MRWRFRRDALTTSALIMTTVSESCLIPFFFGPSLSSGLFNMILFRSLMLGSALPTSPTPIFSFIRSGSVKAFIPSISKASASFSARNKCSDIPYIYTFNREAPPPAFDFLLFLLTFPVLTAPVVVPAMIVAFDLFPIVLFIP